jgi:hypothetical protein
LDLAPYSSDLGPTSAWDLTRRDFVMLGIGAAGVLAAVATGYGLAKLYKPAGSPRPTDEPPPDEHSEK